MAKKGITGELLAFGVTLAIVVLGVVIVVMDWREVQRLLGHSNWVLVPVALAFTTLSYICLSYGFVVAAQIFDIRVRNDDLFEVGFVSIVVNHLISAAGSAGYSLRVIFLQKRGISISSVMALSLFHSYLNNLAMVSLLPIGLIHMLVYQKLQHSQLAGLILAMAVLFVVLFLGAAILFSKGLRSRSLSGIGRAVKLVARRDLRAGLADFRERLEQGVAKARRKPALVALMLVMIAGDWAASVATLWVCFEVIGNPIGLGVLMTGFTVGIVLGLLSLVPGGLGVQEGSMAGIFALSGVPIEQAVLASVMFRVVYYFVPFLVSLPFFWRLLRKVKSEGLEMS